MFTVHLLLLCGVEIPYELNTNVNPITLTLTWLRVSERKWLSFWRDFILMGEFLLSVKPILSYVSSRSHKEIDKKDGYRQRNVRQFLYILASP